MRINKTILLVIFLIFLSAQFFSQIENSAKRDQEELEIILEKCAKYCERLSNSALHFVCEETINEELNQSNFERDRVVTSSGGNMTMRSIAGGQTDWEGSIRVGIVRLIILINGSKRSSSG